MERIISIFRKYLWLIGLIPIFFYFKTVFLYGTNIPHWDDYAIISFLQKYDAANSFQEKLSLIFAQHNEHRIAFTRIIALIIFKLTGNLDFRILLAFGNLALLGILWIFYKLISHIGLSINYLLPISFLLFQLCLFENSLWGMASVQNFWVIFFVLLAIWQLSENEIPYFFTFLATFTSANGLIFLIVIGLLVYILKRDYQNLYKFLAFCFILLFLYFFTFNKLPNTTDQNFNLKGIVSGFFLVVGSLFDLNIYQLFEKRNSIALVAGIILFGAFIINFTIHFFEKRKISFFIRKEQYFIFGVFLFICGTILATAYARHSYGIYVFLTSKYKIYSILFLIITYLVFILNFRHSIPSMVLMLFFVGSIYIYLNSYYYSIDQIKNYRNTELANYYNAWHQGKPTIENKLSPYYSYQNTIFDSKIEDDSLQMNTTIGKVIVGESEIKINNTNFVQMAEGPGDGPFLEFIEDENRFIFPGKREIFNNKKQYFTGKGKLYTIGFESVIPLTEIPTGNFFVNLIKQEGKKITRIPNNFYLEVEGKDKEKVPQNWE